MSAVLVVLRPAGGGDLGAEPITAETVERSLPAPEAAATVRAWFQRAGFRLGPLVAISFSAEGSRDLTERWFPDFAALEGSGEALGLEELPADIASLVQAVVSEAPPAFGPGNP